MDDTSSSVEIDACLACGSKKLKLALDLGRQALANNFQVDRVNIQEYPLATNYCEECSHLQLTHSVNPKILFSNYLYVSGTTKTLKEYFRKFAEKIDERFVQDQKKSSKKRIIDVACNDGTQLNYFKTLGWATMGVDPAINLHSESSKNHFVICDFLSEHHGNFLHSDVLIAQNVLAHTNNPLEFLQIASKIAETIFIQTSQAFMVERNEFDTTYHEHVSYFSELSMFKLAQRAGLKLTKVEIMPIHGDSFLFTLEKNGQELQEPNPLEYEKVKLFGNNAREILKKIDSTIIDHKKRGRVVVGYGAAAKGMTVLNALNASVDFLIDDSELKLGKYSPGKLYQVKGIQSLSEVQAPVSIILLAWNFEAEIRERISALNLRDVEFITYFPDVKVSK